MIAGRKFLPLLGCLCVQDSPQNPCICPGQIIWLPVERILLSAQTDRKNDQGQTVHSFMVDANASVVVEETARSCSVRDLHRMLAVQEQFDTLLLDEEKVPSLTFKPNRVVVQLVKTAVIALIDALASLDYKPPKDPFGGIGGKV